MPLLRHPDFDALTTGWGSDTLEQLHARMNRPFGYEEFNRLLPAELKVKNAMASRLVKLTVESGQSGDAP